MSEYPKKQIAIVVIFALLIILPVLNIRWIGGDYSEAEKRLLAPFPTLIKEEGGLNSEAIGEIKSWFEDHIGFREQLVRLNSEIKYNLFHQSPSSEVHIGKDGWFYYIPNENLEIATGKYTLTEDTLEMILRLHLSIRDRLREKGIEYVVVMPPSKVSIYPEHMRYGSEDVRVTPVDLVADYLEQNSDLRIVRLKETLLEAKEFEQVFFKTDTHWNERGAYVAYQKIIEEMNRWGLCQTQPAEVKFVEDQHIGEFGPMMGIELPPEPTLLSHILEQKAKKNVESARYAELKSVLESERYQGTWYHYENEQVNGPTVLMYGDSMFGMWNATELLAENFSEFTFMRDYNISERVVDTLHPNIVIYEMTERYLNEFPDTNLAFANREVLADYQADIQSLERFPNGRLVVTVKNISQSEWDNLNRIRCCIWSDDKDTGYRAFLPEGETVQPGEIVTLEFDNIQALTGTKVEVQMLQEGYTYFGERALVFGSR